MAEIPVDGREQQNTHTVAAVVVEVDQLVNSIEAKLQGQASDGGSDGQGPPTIYRVRPSVRKEDEAAYDPKIVSIGPFHRGKPDLEPMEGLKLRFLHDLLRRSPTQNTVKKYVDAVRSCEKRAREQYSEKIELESDDFVEMMVLDGCFVVEYLVKRGLERIEGVLAAVNWNLSLLRNDLLLAENQIPFFVLEALFDKSVVYVPKSNDDSPVTLMELALHYLKIKNLPTGPCPEIRHLLHLFHLSLDPDLFPEKPTTRSCGRLLSRAFRRVNLIPPIFFGFLYLILMCKRPRFASSKKSSRFPRMIPCATELREAGISFKKRKKEEEAGVGNSYLKISFEDGTMAIPFLSIEEATNSRFRNLIAFEQCYPNAGSHFTSYAVFMDNIINTASDVAVLRSRGIVESKLGSDKEVAIFFNKLCKGAHLNYDKHYLAGVFRDVNEYCDSARHRWRASLVHEYFSNPWLALSLVGAILILLFTAAQAFFAVFAYFRPPRQR